MKNYMVVVVVVVLMALGASRAKAEDRPEFPSIYSVTIEGGSYETVVIGYIGRNSEDGLPTSAIVFMAGDDGQIVLDEVLYGCEFWPTDCTESTPEDRADIDLLINWSLARANGQPLPFAYDDTEGGPLSLPMFFTFVGDAASALLYPQLPGRWVSNLEISTDRFGIYTEGNYPDGGIDLAWNASTRQWYVHSVSEAAEYQLLADFSVALLNGQTPPEIGRHPQIELEYRDFLLGVRQFQRSALYTQFVPIAKR